MHLHRRDRRRELLGYDNMLTCRGRVAAVLASFGCILVPLAYAEDPIPEWVLEFAESADSTDPTRMTVVRRSSGGGSGNEWCMKYRRRGDVALTSAGCGSIAFDRPPEQIDGWRYSIWSDGVTARKSVGWTVADVVSLSLEGRDAVTAGLSGHVAPVEPGESPLPFWMSGLQPTPRTGYAGLLLGSRVDEATADRDSWQATLSSVPADCIAFEGATLRFDRTREWKLASVKYAEGFHHTFEGGHQVDSAVAPMRVQIIAAGGSEPAVIEVVEFSLETLDSDPRLDFPDGLLITDDRGMESIYRVADNGELVGAMSFEEFSKYGLKRAGPPVDGPGIDGRTSDYGWSFWITNGTLLLTAGLLFWMRRRFA